MITLLAVTPIWFIFAVLFFLCIGILPIGRRYFEGFPYNISIASAYGDVALIICVSISATILQRQGAPVWLYNYEIPAALLSIVIGIIDGVVIAGGPRRNTTMDNYHNFFIVPLLVYLVIFIGIPIIIEHATLLEWLSFCLLIFIWVKLMVYDFFEGRLQQCKYLKSHQVTQV